MTSAFVTRVVQGGLLALLLMGLVLGSAQRVQAQTGVKYEQPEQASIVAEATDTIEVVFTAPVNIAPGEDSLQVYGSQGGRYQGNVRTAEDTLRFIPDCSFRPGEHVMVVVSEAVTAARATPYVWQFTVRTEYGGAESGSKAEFTATSPVSLGGEGGPPAKMGGVSIPTALTAADFNQDLLTDIAFVNQKNENVQVWYGSGLQQADSLSMPGAVTLATGDVTGNGRPDLVTVHSFQDSLGIVRNQQNGLVRGQKISTGPRPTDVAVADLNGDGAQDLAVTPFGGSGVVVHLNDGTGSFGPGQSFAAGAAPTNVLARDVDLDGDLDLILASAGEEAIEWLENDGTGTFSVGTGQISLPFVPSTLVARDVFGVQDTTMGDGQVDLIVGAEESSRIVGYEKQDSGNFSFTQRAIPSPLEDPAQAMTLTDFDSGLESTYDLDFFSTHRSSGSLQLTLNQANDGYNTSGDLTIEPSLPPVGVANLDLDRDGDQDVVVAGPQGTQFQGFLNPGGRPGPIKLDPTAISFGPLCVGDDSTASLQVTSRSNHPVELTAEDIPEGFAVASSLPDTLQPQQTRTLRFTFAPDQIGDFSGAFILGVDELTKLCGRPTPAQTTSIPLSGTGEDTDLSATPDTLTFGEIYSDSTSTRETTLTNDGNIDADVVGVEGLDGSAFSPQQTPDVIPGNGGQRSVTFLFDPPAADSTYRDTAEVVTASTCGNDTTRVVLRGRTKPRRADLVAEQLDVVDGDPDTIRATESLGFQCQFSNQGRTDAGAFAVAVRRGGEREGRVRYDSLDVNQRVRTDTVEVTFPEPGTAVVVLCSVDDDDEVTERREGNNVVRRTIDVEPRPAPNLVAERLEPVGDVPSPLRVNDSLKFVHSVSNQGSEKAAAFEAIVTRNGTPVDTITYEGGLQKGESRRDTTTVRFVSEGRTTIRYASDPDSTIDERGRIEDNDKERTYEVAPRPAPNLVAERLEPVGEVPSPLRVSDTLRFVHSVSNQGSEGAGAFEAVVARNGTPVDTIAYEGGLGEGEESRLDTTAVRFESEGSTTIRYAADPDSTVDERGRTDDNDEERTYEVAPPPAPDLAALDVRPVEADPGDIRVADTVAFVCEYGNQGEEPAESSFSVQISQEGNEVQADSASGLPVGASRETDPASFVFQEQGETEVLCEVDPNERVGERGRLDNNVARLPVTVQRPEQLPVRPNPFTPNGDGVNETVTFKVKRFGLTEPVLRIYTFKGRQLRTIDQVQSGELQWDGTNSGGEAQPPGVYLYVVRDGGRAVASGHVTLAR